MPDAAAFENRQPQDRISELTQSLIEAERIFNAIDFPVVVVDRGRRIRRFTPAAEKILGLGQSDIGGPIGRLNRGTPKQKLADLLSGAIAKAEPVECPLQIGSGRWYSLRIRPLSSAEDKALGALMCFVDIDDLKKFQEKETRDAAAIKLLLESNDDLWRSRNLRASLGQIVRTGMTLLRAEFGDIHLLNPESQALELVAQRGFTPALLNHVRELSAADASSCRRAFLTKERVIIEDVNKEPGFEPNRAAAAAAGFRSVQSTPLIGSLGQVMGIFSTRFREPHRPAEQELVWFDIYANRIARVIERLRIDEQLQTMTGALISSHEARNREIARELHDVFSQELAALALGISSLRKSYGANRELKRRLSELSSKAAEIGKAIHRTSRELHPAMLEDLGLEPALRRECESFRQNHGILTGFESKDLPRDMPYAVTLCLYRVAQESLRNVGKHAVNADSVRVSLTGTPDGIRLVIEDSGGFNPQRRQRGLGLITMEERLRAVKGELTIQSTPGKGTTVSAFVPLPGQDE